ncbi:hypothetical protein H109_01279 [Trichophyton interdigitale MR816]|uniref:E3 ubiquitin protein ligase n=1 Tax=Trichophyton interdigitale (strain MR816) TaxID=1215338 RepID=A0A059JGE1_TRIIM|nr:hypothetical protein H101_04595 [Trichophyton interdigitale H6]KDB26935.1 hypothetical protein H109_01279 [Trichophyton interdigitale MR816]
MTALESPTVSLPKSGLVVKMEDRKRLATQDPGDSAPPLKKQATTVNGGVKAHPDTDMPWRDDLEVRKTLSSYLHAMSADETVSPFTHSVAFAYFFVQTVLMHYSFFTQRYQKDAIWRQMQEYKREKTTLESRIKDLSKKVAYNEEHVSVLDAWLKQLIDEVKVISSSVDESSEENPTYQTSLLFSGHEAFEKHLQDRASEIKGSISRLLSNAAKATPDITSLQSQLAKKLADEKAVNVAIEKAIAEKQQLEERLEAASLRYMVAEKKIDRAKSLTVARLEKQHILGPHKSGDSSTKREEGPSTNGTTDNPEKATEMEMLYNTTLAVSNKQKEQLERLEAENSKLLTQITELHVKLSKLSDEDYAHCDLFKQLKSQHEDVIQRINHLEATNIQLREEAEKLQAERTAYRVQIENEAQNTIGEKEAQLAKTESNLVRIRNARDELLADQQMRKATEDQEKHSVTQLKELLDAKESRITSLEQEVQRVQLQIDGVKDSRPNNSELSHEQLRTKFDTLEKQYEMLNMELSSMQIAFRKSSKLASQKIADTAAAEERVQRLMAEKSKADQKYFAAMQSKESRDAELRSLRLQNMKSSDIISQLKEAEAATRTLVSNVEKQLSETKEALTSLTNQYRTSQHQVNEATIVIQGLKSQVAELKGQLATKDATLTTATNNCRKAESEVEGLKITLSDTKKSLESWKSRGLGNNTSEYEMLRVSTLSRNFTPFILTMAMS